MDIKEILFSKKEYIMFSSKPYEEFKREIKEIYNAGGLPSDPKTLSVTWQQIPYLV